MLEMITTLCGWMPDSLQVLVIGVVAIFVIITLMRLISFILDCIPFL